MEEFMKRAKHRLDEENLNVEDWEIDIRSLDATIDQFLTNNNYDYEISKLDNISLFQNDTDTRLMEIERLYKTINENKEKGLIQGVLRAQKHMYDFLDYYNIGHLSKFYLQKSYIYAELFLSINKMSILDSNKETNRLIFEKQCQRLTDLGLEFMSRERGSVSYQIKDTSKNKQLLIELLKLIGMKHLEFKVNENCIDTVTGIINIDKFLKYKIPKDDFNANSDVEKKDKLLFIRSSLKELYHLLAIANSKDQNIYTYGYLIEHYFKNICDTFGIETKLSKRFEKYHMEERKKNNKIHEYESKIGELLNGKDLCIMGNNYFNKMGLQALKNIGFNISSESYIGPYNVMLIYRTVSIDSIFRAFDSYEIEGYVKDNEIDNLINETISYLEKSFDFIEPFRDEKYIAYTEKNMKQLSEWVEKIFSQKIDSFEIHSKQGLLYISSFSVLLERIATNDK